MRGVGEEGRGKGRKRRGGRAVGSEEGGNTDSLLGGVVRVVLRVYMCIHSIYLVGFMI